MREKSINFAALNIDGTMIFDEKHSISPWFWVPTLYFAEGIPYFLVNTISVMMFTRMGVANDAMSFFTTLLYFPWFLKCFWAPVVDNTRTKRWWIVSMQVVMTVLMVILCLTLPQPTISGATSTSISVFRWTLILFIITAFASATHDIAADGFYMLAQSPGSQAAFIGIRSTFYRIAMVFGQGVLVYLAGYLERTTGDIPAAWRITIGVSALVFALITLYHLFVLPHPEHYVASQHRSVKEAFSALLRAFGSFFVKPGALIAILFMLLYRLPEGFLVKLCMPFLVQPHEAGGLGLSTDMVGLAYGTLGVIFLLLGGLLGGLYISRVGLKRALWPMAIAITLPDLVFVYMSAQMPDSLLLITTLLGIEQFGYGFGFTAYMMYMMYFADGEYKTTHYAICTAFMALSMMLPGFVAGILQMAVGYKLFFLIVMGCCLITFIITYFVYRKINPDYGKK